MMDLSSEIVNNEKNAFDDTFISKYNDIINTLTAIESNEIQTDLYHITFQEVMKKINELQEYLNDCKVFLPAYNMKKCSNTIKELTRFYENLHDKLLPKKKFAFRKNQIKSPKQKEVKSNFRPLNNLVFDDCGFKNRSNESLKLLEDQTFSKDIVLENLNNCNVLIYGSPSTIHITSLDNCKIFACAITSIFIENCKKTIFTCASQQLRIHETSSCDFYIYVVSSAIIENSKNLRFGPLKINNPIIENIFKVIKFDINNNNWKIINDFDWLSSYEPSPNWKEIPEYEYNQPNLENP
ncbi:tubulin-specific chaperone C [Daktulosphaira vitifoliae]|uniref:tubulin-specific chaperone C n=1 Tax=Daktulosphaira vitifoliae TaxID=58002 RepID=UPI0021AA856D|nr:tubulin-specific chaperone C [Daktulosphaira vitifoliae]XP_050537574.1 tubulin-specific chaperone C [Daktulosphaira vitifoliae]XP_050537575.1 tubulin-specific chaperone C [Daktulosphaira vitifoliae]XP_050537576.1 tubulin-specific chaperone C [Daktulosphaira vitifoliae]